MSTFSGLGTALSSLIAQRQAPRRRRPEHRQRQHRRLHPPARHARGPARRPACRRCSRRTTAPARASRVTGIDRLADAFLDARLRTQTSGASYLKARADAYATLEGSIGEPGDRRASPTSCPTMWGAWADVANTPDKDSARAVLLNDAERRRRPHRAPCTRRRSTQWNQARTTTVALVDQVNTTAASVADLNARILDDHEQRRLGAASSWTSATSWSRSCPRSSARPSSVQPERPAGRARRRQRPRLRHPRARARRDRRASAFSAGHRRRTATRRSPASVQVVWAEHPTRSAGARRRPRRRPAVGARSPGRDRHRRHPHRGRRPLRRPRDHDRRPRSTRCTATALTAGGTPGGDFFTFAAGRPAALGPAPSRSPTRPTWPSRAPGGGALDGSVGATIADLANATDGPNAQWSKAVVELGVAHRLRRVPRGGGRVGPRDRRGQPARPGQRRHRRGDREHARLPARVRGCRPRAHGHRRDARHPHQPHRHSSGGRAP